MTTIRTPSNQFSADFCKYLLKKYELRGDSEEELQARINDAFILFNCIDSKNERTPSAEETRELFNYISKLSGDLHNALSKLSFNQKLDIAGDNAIFNLKELDSTSRNLNSLQICSELAFKYAEKGKGGPPKKNSALITFATKLSDAYIDLTTHRNSRSGIRKIDFIVECFDHSNVNYMKGIKSSKQDRISKLLSPTPRKGGQKR